jgi:hypothetical protein
MLGTVLLWNQTADHMVITTQQSNKYTTAVHNGTGLVEVFPNFSRKDAWAIHCETVLKYDPNWIPPDYTPKKGSTLSSRKRYRLLKEWDHCCYCLNKIDDTTATLDHILPKSLGGSGRIYNLVLSCQPCNISKGREWKDCNPKCPKGVRKKFSFMKTQYPFKPAD